MVAQAASLSPSGAQRAVALGAVAALHVLLLVVLTSTGAIPPLLPAILPARLILQPATPPPPPPPVVLPTLAAAPPAFVPPPDIAVATPPPTQPLAPRAITRAAPRAAVASHFGAATDSGLGLDLAASTGGGTGARGTLAAFEAATRARILAAKHQPALAWDRRNTCIVNYRVFVAPSGALAGFSIDPCAIPEINQAASQAIRNAAPFPQPPALGGSATEVHGSMIFHP